LTTPLRGIKTRHLLDIRVMSLKCY